MAPPGFSFSPLLLNTRPHRYPPPHPATNPQSKHKAPTTQSVTPTPLQALCNLPYQFSPRLQQLVHRSVNFVSPAQRVRRAGLESLQAMVRGACLGSS